MITVKGIETVWGMKDGTKRRMLTWDVLTIVYQIFSFLSHLLSYRFLSFTSQSIKKDEREGKRKKRGDDSWMSYRRGPDTTRTPYVSISLCPKNRVSSSRDVVPSTWPVYSSLKVWHVSFFAISAQDPSPGSPLSLRRQLHLSITPSKVCPSFHFLNFYLFSEFLSLPDTTLSLVVHVFVVLHESHVNS